MTLNDFVNNVEDFTDVSMVCKYKLFLKQAARLCDDPEALRQAILDGMLDGFVEAESMDSFGTEGMQL